MTIFVLIPRKKIVSNFVKGVPRYGPRDILDGLDHQEDNLGGVHDILDLPGYQEDSLWGIRDVLDGLLRQEDNLGGVHDILDVLGHQEDDPGARVRQ